MSSPVAQVRLRVSPGAHRSAVVGRYGDAWKVRVTQPPERGRANIAVIELLARALGVPQQSVRIAAGATARDKVVELEGLTNAEAERRLAAAGKECV